MGLGSTICDDDGTRNENAASLKWQAHGEVMLAAFGIGLFSASMGFDADAIIHARSGRLRRAAYQNPTGNHVVAGEPRIITFHAAHISQKRRLFDDGRANERTH